MAPDRLNIMTLKNVAADGTFVPRLNSDHRVTEMGRTTREYARG
jgi:hypothetical protein